MDKLPAEVLELICSSLDPPDVQTFRMLSRPCASIGLEYLLPVINFALLQKDFDRLIAVGAHPGLRHRVHTLHLETMLLGPIWEFKEYRKELFVKKQVPLADCIKMDELLLDSMGMDNPRALRKAIIDFKRAHAPQPVPLSQAREGWVLFNKVLEQQDDLYNQIADISLTESLLRNFPGLKCIRYHVRGYWNFERPLSNENKRVLSKYSGTFKEPEEMSLVKDDSIPLLALLEGASRAGATVTEVSAGQISWKVLKSQAHHQNPYVSHLLSQLKSLSVSFRLGDPQRIDVDRFLTLCAELHDDQPGDKLGMLVTCSPALEVLRVHFDDMLAFCPGPHEAENYLPGKLDDTFKGFLWPSLHTLELKGFCVSKRDFVKFLGAHHTTIQQVDLAMMHLTDDTDTWETVFAEIVTYLQKLLSLKLRMLFTSLVYDHCWDFGELSDGSNQNFGDAVVNMLLTRSSEHRLPLPVDPESAEYKAEVDRLRTEFSILENELL